MLLQRLPVIDTLVAEFLAERLRPAGVLDQPVEIVMADLVAKMPEQRAIRLAHRGAGFFAMRVVGFGDVHRDQPVVVPRQHLFADPAVLHEVELQAVRRVLLARYHRQAQRLERIQQAALGGFEPEPVETVVGLGEIRDGVRQLARLAQGIFGVGRDHPVADAFQGIVRALFVALVAGIGREIAPGAVAGILESCNLGPVGQETEQGVAALADDVFKENEVRAAAAVESFHDWLNRRKGSRSAKDTSVIGSKQHAAGACVTDDSSR